MGTILSRENILLAYRSIKGNDGSVTPGTDKTTIKDLGALTPEELVEQVRFIVSGSVHGYRPKEPLNKSPSFSAERENRRLPLGSSDSVGK